MVVAGGDAVVGRTPKLLLENANYQVRFVSRSCLGEPGGLEGANPIVLAPALTQEQEAAALAASAGGTHGVARVPMVGLFPDLPETTSADEHRSVLWPHRAGELERQIRAALDHAPGARTEEEG